MAKRQTEREDRALAAELARRLDEGTLAPREDDSPELKALLATYSRLHESAPKPHPALEQRVKRAIVEDAEAGAAQKEPEVRRPRRWLAPAFYAVTALLVLFGFAALRWVDTMPSRLDDQQTVLVGQGQLSPGSEASVRVIVQDFARGEPVEGALVKVSLDPAAGRAIPLFEGETDGTGSLPVHFTVPGDLEGEAQLVVETRSEAGRDRLEQTLVIQRDYRLLLSSDKPLYQPGQTIHMRALALSTLDLAPARGETVNFLVEDPKGNKVFRQSVDASEYGIASTDFLLADLVNQGSYKLSVSIEGAGGGETRSERTVEVQPYVLPKFGVEVSTERNYYLPGQRVEGVVQADYFFGKPVSGGQVQISGSVWDVERTVVVDLRGETGENGAYVFSFDLPDYFAGSGLDLGQAQFALEVTVIDQADHAEQTSIVLPIAEQPLVIEAVAESGVLRAGVENIVYILTSYPDGRPAPAVLQVSVNDQDPAELATGEYGLAEFAFTPQTGVPYLLEITAQDEAGLAARREVDFVTGGGDSVLLRADRAAYVVGETMNLVALTPADSGSIYLDIVKGGQTLSIRSVPVKAGRAEFAVDLSPDLYGTLELHAYKVLLDGSIVRDTRLVVVDQANDVEIEVTAGRDTYLPGETATLELRTTEPGQPGAGLQSALGLAVVDESVFALERQDPGFAKLYFMLEQELMEPFYQIKGFELPATMAPDEGPIRAAQDRAIKATWAGAPVPAAANAINSRQEKQEGIRAGQREGADRIGQISSLGLALIPLLMFVAVVVSARQARILRRAFVRVLVAIGILIPSAAFIAWLLFLILSALHIHIDHPGWLLVAAGAVLGLAILAFTGYAWARRDGLARFLAFFTLAWLALLALLLLAAERGRGPDTDLVFVSVIPAALLAPATYLLFGQGRWIQARRLLGGLGTSLGALLAPAALVVLAAVLLLFGGAGAMGDALSTQGLTSDEALMAEYWDEVEYFTQQGDLVRAMPGIETKTVPEPPRLRQYFPETLYWAPEVVTGDDGSVSVEVPMADSITTWRLTALASTQDGRLGSTTRGIRVFQDFFVDIDLPVSLTQGDEISIPIGVYNYLTEAQQVRLEVEPEAWFELMGPAEQRLTIAPNDIEVVYIPIRVLAFGRQGFQVTAWGEKMSDAIRREVNVVPNGKELRLTESDWLRESKRVPVEVPASALPGATAVEVKIYPGALAQAVEGLEKILRLPHG